MAESIIAEFIRMIRNKALGRALAIWLLASMLVLLAACSAARPVEPGSAANEGDTAAGTPLAALAAPTLSAVVLEGRPLHVLATTSLVGDAVARVGGEAIELTTLMGPGQDPHSYQPAAADLTAVADADVIFINGWGLEEGLLDDLATIGEGKPMVPVSAGIVPREYGGEAHEGEEGGDHAAEGDHGPADPHVWQSVGNVERWVETVRAALSALDPGNAATYAANAEAYTAELQALDGEIRSDLAAIPAEKRVMVTNHETFGYFADDYDFQVLGTVLPSASTTGEPTAQGLAALVTAMKLANVCSVFIETTSTDQLARTLGEELTDCADVHVLTLYTDALGAPGSGADTYPGMMRANVATLVEGLR